MTTQPHNVDQSDRIVPINLRQSGRTPTELLISTRVRKSPYWHLSHEAGCWRATVYNRIYHPRGYVRPEDGGAAAEHEALTHHVTMWNVAVERQIRVQGPDAERFVDYAITRDATRIAPMHGKYVILCNERGGILNDPVLLRLAEDEFWFSLADSDLLFWLQGVNVGLRMDVRIDEIDVCPVQIQGPKSEALMADLVGEGIRHIPYYGIQQVGGCSVVISQSGFSGEKGYEIYLRDATLHAERGAGGGQGAPAFGDRARPPAPHSGRCRGARTSTMRRALPVQSGLPGAAPEEGRLHRQGGTGAHPRAGRRRQSAVHDDDGGHNPGRQADRRLRARFLAGVRRLGRRPDRLPHLAVWAATSPWATCRWRCPPLAPNSPCTCRTSTPRTRQAGPARVCEVPFRPSVWRTRAAKTPPFRHVSSSPDEGLFAGTHGRAAPTAGVRAIGPAMARGARQRRLPSTAT